LPIIHIKREQESIKDFRTQKNPVDVGEGMRTLTRQVSISMRMTMGMTRMIARIVTMRGPGPATVHGWRYKRCSRSMTGN
jgi:hypothetical protein